MCFSPTIHSSNQQAQVIEAVLGESINTDLVQWSTYPAAITAPVWERDGILYHVTSVPYQSSIDGHQLESGPNWKPKTMATNTASPCWQKVTNTYRQLDFAAHVLKHRLTEKHTHSAIFQAPTMFRQQAAVAVIVLEFDQIS